MKAWITICDRIELQCKEVSKTLRLLESLVFHQQTKLKTRANKMLKEIDRIEQDILGGVLIKDLRRLVKDRKEQQLQGTKLKFSNTTPGLGTSIAHRIEKTRMGLHAFGICVNRNKLVVHTM